MSRGIESRREVPPPTRHSISVSERLPASLVFAPASLLPLGRWSVPIISTLSVEVSMLPPEVSAALADAGRLPCSICALMMNSTSDNSSHAPTAIATYLSTRRAIVQPVWGCLSVRRSRSPDGRSSVSCSPRRRARTPRGRER